MGLVWTLLLNGTAGLAGYGIARYGLLQPAGLPRVLAAAILAWAWVTLGMQILGATGHLERGPLLIWSGAGLVLAAMARLVGGPTDDRPPARVAPWGVPATLAIALTLWGALIHGSLAVLTPVKVVSDAPIYHLYFAARWREAGRLILVPTPFGEGAAPYFPANGDLWLTWLLIGLGDDALAKIGQSPFALLSILSVYATARRLGAGAPATSLAMAWFACCELIHLFAFEANTDVILMAGYLVAIYFLVRHALGDGGASNLVPAALAAGTAWGAKPSGIVFLPVLLAIGGLIVLSRPVSWRLRVGRLALLAGLSTLMVGFWYGRNAWLTGNPLYPLQVSAFGRTWLRGWFGPGAMARSPFFLPRGRWDIFLDLLALSFDRRLMPVWLLAIFGAWAIRPGDPDSSASRAESRWVWAFAGLAILNLALYWILIPYRTQGRFMIHAFGLAAVPLARLFDRARAIRWAAVGLLSLHLTTPQTWPWIPLGTARRWGISGELTSVPVGIVGVFRTWNLPIELDYLVFLLASAIGGLLAALTWRRAASWPTASRTFLAVATTIVAGIGIGSGYDLVSGASGRVFPTYPDLEPGWNRLDQLAGPAGARIAYAGTNRPYYLMGQGLRNTVRYVNVDAHRDWLLHDYHRRAIAEGRPNWPDTFPGWARERPDYASWVANLRAERIGLLFVTRLDPTYGLFDRADPANFPIERVWADAHPEDFTPVHGPAQGDPNVRIYRLRPISSD